MSKRTPSPFARISTLGPLSVAIAVALAAQPARANVVGTDMQNFNPITSGLDFVTVHSSETLTPGIINLGLFLNYAVNSLPYYETQPGNRLDFNDTLLSADLNAGIGLGKNWDIGISMPQVLRQRVDDQTGARGEYASTGSTEIRLNSKYRLMGDNSGGLALVGSVNIFRIEDNPYAGSSPGPTFNAEVAADTTLGKTAVGANLGYRFRNPGARLANSPVEPLKNQLIASAAVSHHLPEMNIKVIGEVFGSLPAERTTSSGDRSLSSLELLGGVKYDWNTNLALHAGAGTGLWKGTASPDWRVYTGLNYTFGPVFEQKQPEDRSLVRVPDEPSATEPQERFRTQKILFDFDSDRMVGNFAPVLEELASHLKSGFKMLVIEGHTDSIGAASYNQKLSLRRAKAIEKYMITKHNVDPKKIQSIGYGEERPIADNGNYQGRQDNRRVDFVIQR